MHVSIRIKGHLDPSWQPWLEELVIVHDEYILTVAPLVLLKGKRLFQAGMEAQLQLLESKAYKTGIIRLNYKPIKQ
jgi:dihydrofolate reductase